ncbi:MULTISPECIES: hypothetical protein [Burkholderia]|uniref:Uncharacterized protein n=1 Tax=Burkholderia anthina TaxID=179879 RepID=A0A6P2GE77_9BURK|nr:MULTISPECIES: hypothetical protein [Burkholderia]MBM2769892.1 hypothetical protein [Burkholderia anthina]MCA8293341.1 hypothetical protein [Burkholderia sp. AU30198]VVU51867.1 hypothetical protein BAN20980_04590 [Burkholderia anthina]
MEKLYHVVLVYERTGHRVRKTKRPVTRDRGLELIAAIANRPNQRTELEPATT